MANALLWVAGGGAPPSRLSLTPESMNFGSQFPGVSTTQCATMKSLGPNTLRYTSLTISGSTDFQLTTIPLTDSLQVNNTTQICVTFTPNGLGVKTATLTLVTNGQDSGTQTIDLRGVGAAPTIEVTATSLFRKVNTPLRDSSSACFELKSVGLGDVVVDSVVIAGTDKSAYYLISAPTSIPLGQSRLVCIGFTPNFQGRTDAQVKVYTNAFNGRVVTIPMYGTGTLGRFVMNPGTLDFDSVMMGDKVCNVVMINNYGTDTLRITRNHIGYTEPDFTMTPLSGRDTMILPNDSVAFTVCFQPTKNGTRLARFLFYTDIPMTFETINRDTSEFVLDIMGVGVPVGRLAMTDPVFPGAVVGDELCRTDTLRNGGLSPVTITSASIGGLDASDFTMTGLTVPTTLQPGETRILTICITASDLGTRSGAVIFGTSSDGKTGEAQFDLSGMGLLNCATADPMTAYTGQITYVGTKQTQTITVTNCGEVDRSYTAAIATGTGYTITSATTTGMIAPNGTATFDVEFNPTAMGASNGTLQITGGPDPIDIALNGTGGAVLLGASGSAGTVMQGDCRTFDVTVNNTGNVDWTPGTGTITGANAASFTIESAPASIPAGGTAVVTIKFCPSSQAAETAQLNFPDATPTAITTAFPYTLNGSGIASSVTVTEMLGYKLGQSYPNPMTSTSTMTFTMPHSGNVKIELIDQTGRVIPVTSGFYPMGESTVQIDASNLTSGTYLYVLSNEEVRLSRQLTIVK
jgi:hypothetical protein